MNHEKIQNMQMVLFDIQCVPGLRCHILCYVMSSRVLSFFHVCVCVCVCLCVCVWMWLQIVVMYYSLVICAMERYGELYEQMFLNLSVFESNSTGVCLYTRVHGQNWSRALKNTFVAMCTFSCVCV